MPDPPCVNLLNRFGARYKITFDPAYDPKGRPRDKLDPWMMVIPCERGEIYPYGGNALAIDIEDRPVTAKQVGKLPSTTPHQQGDHFSCMIFNVAYFAEIAKIVKPRKRKLMSEANREAARQRMIAYNDSMSKVPTHPARTGILQGQTTHV